MRKRYPAWLTLTLGVALLLVLLVQSGSAQTPGRGGAQPAATATTAVAPTPSRAGRVSQENQQRGTDAWKSAELTAGRGTPLGERPPGRTGSAASLSASDVWTDTVIRGYADLTSVNHGGAIKFMISTARPSYRIDVYRMGWYGGAGARLMSSATGLTGQDQAVPSPQPVTGLIAAGWQVSYTLQTSADWLSGVFLAKLTADNGAVGYIPFVVRDDGATADIVYQVPFTTYQAYNSWGGKNLYEWGSTGGVRAKKVSFDRPYDLWSGAGGFFDGDYSFIRWLEQQGYSVTYTSSIDTHTTPDFMQNHKIFLSPFHDEYWSKPMRDNITAARGAGKHLAWFGANDIYFQVRMEDSAGGAANRVVVCYKDRNLDPLGPNSPLTTVTWREAPVNQPENALLGVMYESYYPWGTTYPWVVQNANHWLYQGTGLANGDQIADLVGYEYDKVWNNGQSPADLTVLSASPVEDWAGTSGTANGTLYTHSSGAVVFAAGTIYWPWLLDTNEYQNHGADPRVQRMTANLLARMITGVAPTATPSPTPMASAGATIYTDALASGWSRTSWHATVNLAATTQVYAGTKAISFATTGTYGSMTLTRSSAMSVSGLAALRFAARATQPGVSYAVWLLDGSGAALSPGRYLVNYGGDPVETAWKQYVMPLDADNLGAAGHLVKSIVIEAEHAAPQPALYLDEIVFTSTAAPVAPSGPTGQALGTVTSSSIQIQWADPSTAETNYQVAWSPHTPTSYTYVDLPANTTTWTHSGLSAGQTYYYWIRGCNGGLCSAFTPAVTGITSGGSPPASPSAMAVTGTTATSVTVGWSDNSGNETNFRVAYTTSSFAVYLFQSLPANSTSWTHNDIATGDTYYYWVQSCLGALCTAWAGGIAGTAGAAPPAPSNVQATNVTPTSVTLGWTDNSSNETRFDLAWTANNGVSWTVVPLNPNTVNWLHSGVTSGTEYVYFVHACYYTLCSEWAGDVRVTPGGANVHSNVHSAVAAAPPSNQQMTATPPPPSQSSPGRTLPAPPADAPAPAATGSPRAGGTTATATPTATPVRGR